tara:strand:- start:492 stop:1262 length:771 start_codon:yes stop_codon:yes gene_type:complete
MSVNFFSSKKVDEKKIKFAFFTRKGGFSSKNFSSLNCSYSSGDNKQNVKKNIDFALKKINLENKILKTVNQIHSNKVVVVNNKNITKSIEADGLISQDRKISIAILTADCCPIFFYDTDASFICCIHSGWKGTYKNIIDNALNKVFKIQPVKKKIKAVIGPCLDKKNFEVDQNFKKKFINKDKKNKAYFLEKLNSEKSLFDMRGLIKSQILKNKIADIEDIAVDTYSNKNLFYSHRRSVHSNLIPTGRMLNIIGFI